MKNKLLLISLLLLIFCVVPASAEYSQQQVFSIDSAVDLTNYQMKLTLSNEVGVSSGTTIYTNGSTQRDWDDLKFNWMINGVDQGVNCDYWLDLASKTATTITCYVEVPCIYANDTAGIKLLYGDSAANTLSNGYAVFPLCDFFGGNAIDSSKWVTNGSVYVHDGISEIGGAASTASYVKSKTTYGEGYSVMIRASVPKSLLSQNGVGFMYLNPTGGMENSIVWASCWDSPYSRLIYNTVNNKVETQDYAQDYHNFEISRTGSGVVDLYVDSAQVVYGQASANTSAMTIGMRSYDPNRYLSVDHVIVRKCTSIEPTLNQIAEVGMPEAVFSASATEGIESLTVSFTDQSINAPTSWSWDFGDGSTSTNQNPVHTYAPGTYTVTFTVTNAAGSNTETKTGYIFVDEPEIIYPPIPAFTWGRPGELQFKFIDQSINGSTSWLWEFGDGSTSTAQNPVHDYAAYGSYPVKLTVSNIAGSNALNKTLTFSIKPNDIINLVGPQWEYVEFNASKEFSFTTDYGVLNSHWFVNGVETNFTSLNMSYTFDQPGRNYNISVWAETTEGNSSMIEYRVTCGREPAGEHIVPFNNSNYYNLMNATSNLDMDGIMKWSFAPFTDSMGRMAYCIVFILPFIYLWFNTGKLTLPTTLSLIVGCVFIGYVPSQFTTFIGLVIVMAYAAAFYKLSRGN